MRQKFPWRFSYIASAIGLIALLYFGESFPNGAANESSTISVTAFANANNAFGFQLFSEIAQREGNLVVSPWSIDVALATAHVGANEDTASQIAKALGWPGANYSIYSV